MLLIRKYIFPFLLICFCSNHISAQQTLPSLIESKHNTDSDPDEQLASRLKQKMYVKIFTSKNKVFVGEPLMVTYKFYASMQISDQPSVTKQPEFTGCSVKELDFDQGPEFDNINNEQFAIYTIRSVQITPLQAGSLSLGKAHVNNFLQFVNPDDPFVPKKYNIDISNADVNVEVATLPETNEPSGFNGLVGKFAISASVDNKSIPVGENGHLIVTIKGSGNLEAINKPDIKWPADIDPFDGTDSQHIDPKTFPISGDRVFEIPFVGKKEGTKLIEPINFSFFNADTKNYQTITTDPIVITFTKALSKKDEFNKIVPDEVSNQKYLWIVAGIAIVVICISLISYRKNKKLAAKKTAAVATPVPEFSQPQPVYTLKFRSDFSKQLEDLKNIENNKQFFEDAKKILTTAVCERVDSTQHSEQVLIAELKQRTYYAPVCNKTEALYEAINLQLYAPYETEVDREFYFNNLKAVVEELQAET